MLEFLLEILKQRERVRGSAREPGQDLVVVQIANLARIALHDLVAERDLPVTAECHVAAAAYANDSRAVEIIHVESGLVNGPAVGRQSFRRLARGCD